MARIVNAPPRIMEGASADEPGVAGYVPTPPAGPVADGLRRDGTYGPTNSSGGGGGGGGDGIPADGSVTNAKVAANAAIALSKLAVDPLARSAHTGTQPQNTVVNLVADLAAKATGAALTAHTADTANPHSVTKAQVGLTNADDTSDATKPVSTAQAAAIALKADAAHAHDAAAITSGSLDPERLPAPTTTTIGGVKRNAGSAGQFVNGIDASGGLVFGDPPGGGGGTPDAHAASHAAEGSDPLTISQSQVAGLPDALTTLDTDLGTAESTLATHVASTANPHSVTKAQVGLTSADDTSDANKPVSTAQAAAIAIKADATTVSTHIGDTANPHAVTKAQVGLTSADDTSDANKPVSTAQAATIALKADASTVSTHIADTANPHAVTKAQVGLTSADDTSDANKPISTATATALALKADADALGTMAAQNANAVAITGGSINGTPIGATTPSTGSFTAAKVSSNVTDLPPGPATTTFHVGGADGAVSRVVNDAFDNAANFAVRRANGTNAVKTKVVAGNVLGSFSSYGYKQTDYSSGGVAFLLFQTPEDWTDDSTPTSAGLWVTAPGSTSPSQKLLVEHNQIALTVALDMASAYKQTINAVGALDIDCSLGNYFTKTIAGNSTFTVSNVPATRAYSFVLELTHTSGTVTWFSGVEWPGGTAPTLTAGKTHLLAFVTDDGGTRWRAASQVNYTN